MKPALHALHRLLLLASIAGGLPGVLPGGLPGQGPRTPNAATGEAENWYSVRHWAISDGLPQISVSALLRDDRGPLWVGTEAGPSWFDGEEFSRPVHSDGVPGRKCVALARFGDDRIASLTSRGHIVLIDASAPHGFEAPPELLEFTREIPVRLIARFGSASLALASEQGLYTWRRGRPPALVEAHASRRILALATGQDDSLWLGTTTGAFHIGSDGSERRIEGLPDALCFDALATHTWVGTQDGPFRLDAEDRIVASPATGLPALACRAVAEHPHGDLAVVDADRRLHMLQTDEAGSSSFAILPRNHVLSLARSGSDDALWVGTLSHGLARVFEQPLRRLFVRDDHPANQSPSAVYLARDGALWIGTSGQGILRSKPDSRELERVPGTVDGATTFSFFERRDGSLLLGRSDGLAQWDGAAITRLPPPDPDARPPFVRSIRADRNGGLWLGTSAGAWREADGGWARVPVAGEGPQPDLWCLTLDGDSILAGARDGGLYRSDGSTLTRVPLGDPFDGLPISAIQRVGGTLWLGGLGGEIVREHGAGWRQAKLPDRFEPINILGFASFDDGILWVSSTGGILALDTTTPIDRSPLLRGLPSPAAGRVEELNGHSDAALAVDPLRRRLYAPGLGGVLEVDTTAFLDRSGDAAPNTRPAPLLRTVTLDGVPHGITAECVEVPADALIVAIEYQDPVLGSPRPIRYRHRLCGFDDTWVEPNRRLPAVFTDLRPGDYVFECQTGSLAAWDSAVARLPIRVLPSLTERLDFRLGLAALALAAIALGVREFTRRQRRHAHQLEAEVDARTAALAAEVRLKEAAEAALRRSNDELDHKVRVRTAELESTYQQLVQAQKLESVARLAGGLAHDLNNLLTAILGFAETAGEELPEDGPGREDIAEIRRAGERAATLVQQLLTFARPRPPRPRAIQVHDLVSELEPMLVGLLRPDRQLQVDDCDCTCTVFADPIQLEQVITNLVVNARDATPRGGPPIRLEAGPLAGTGEVCFTVSDRGSGIAPEHLARIFDPFFTTRETGTGLGLSVCHGIVQRHGGRIEVESEVGVGSTFRVVLPRGVAAKEPADPDRQPVSDSRPVLVVDDQQPIRSMMERSLRRAGFEVITADGVANALDAVAGRELLGVVTDVVMPGGSGDQLVRRLRELHPDLPALYVSGFAPQSEVLLEQDSRTCMLSKPFGPDELVRCFRELLQSPQDARPG